MNWVLAGDAVDYLARDNEPTIVQHYWSLSVEEQFYLVWPVLLVAVCLILAVLARRRGKRSAAGRMTGLMIFASILIVVSLAYSIWTTHFWPSRAYFDTFARAWEFAAGGLLAMVVARFPAAIEKFRASHAVSTLGLPMLIGMAMILGSALLIDSATPFPSFWAAVPVVGALLVILGGMPSGRFLARITGARIVQFFGDISYSLYLWHWPIIIGFGQLAARKHSVLEGIAIFVIAVLLAWMTKVAVEDPVRKYGRARKSSWSALGLAATGAIVLVVASTVVVTQRAEAAAQQQEQRAESLVQTDGCVGANATLGNGECLTPFDVTPGASPVPAEQDLNPDWCLTWFDEDWRSCTFGDDSAPAAQTVAIVGDSHAAALTNPFGDWLADEGYKLETFTRFGCPALSPTPIGLRAQTPETEQACATWSERVIDELVQRDDILLVIFTSFESAYATPEEPGAVQLTSANIVESLSAVAASGKQVVLLRDFASTGAVDVPTCVAAAADPASECSVPLDIGYPATPFDEAIEALGNQIRVVSPRPATCDESACYAVVGDVLVYADDNHVSESFAKSLMPYLGRALIDAQPLDVSNQ
ncbi:acyltransferase family protein [Microbacterium mitrae]